jgi:hypothetical protein
VGTAVGAAVGAEVGGYAGKWIGELIDPTTEDNWLRDNFSTRPYAKGRTFDSYIPAYRYGAEAEARHGDRRFEDFETDLEGGWRTHHQRTGMNWSDARPAVRDAYDRACQIRKQRQMAGRS